MGGDPGVRGGDLFGRRSWQNGLFLSEHNGAWVGDIERVAHFSLDREHRYSLSINWFWHTLFAMADRQQADKIAAGGVRRLMVCAMNPSTADAFQDDPTVRRMIGFAKSWGFGELVVTNVMAYRSTDPKALPKDLEQAMGAHNVAWLKTEARGADQILMAYGAIKGMHAEAAKVAEAAILTAGKPLYRLSSKPFPRHPLYAPGADTAELWRTPDA